MDMIRYSSVFTIILVAMVLDLILWQVFQSPTGFFVRAAAYSFIGVHASLGTIGVIGLIAMVPHFYAAGTFGTDLLVLVPCGVLWYYLNDIADIPPSFKVAAIGSLVFLQGALLEGLLLGVKEGLVRVSFAFLSAVIMVYLIPGSQGDRSFL